MLEIQNVIFQRAQQNYRFHASAPAASLTLIRGASGIGKSTLLDCLAGFAQPQGGKLCWNGQEFQHKPVHQRPLSLLQQKDNLFPHLNVLDNVCLGMGGISTAGRAQAYAILQQLELHSIAQQSIDNISGGQAQRVGIARALLRHQSTPRPILLLDEPYSALDEDTAEKMHQQMVTLCTAHQLCILLVAHREVPCDQVWHVVQLGDCVSLDV